MKEQRRTRKERKIAKREKEMEGNNDFIHFVLIFKIIYDLTTLISQIIRSRSSAVPIATGYGLDDRGFGVRVPLGSRIFSSPCRLDRLWGPLSLLSNAYRGSFPGVKQQRREADHSPPTTAEVKKTWIYTPTPLTPSWRSA
jgi:hypothetical protein